MKEIGQVLNNNCIKKLFCSAAELHGSFLILGEEKFVQSVAEKAGRRTADSLKES